MASSVAPNPEVTAPTAPSLRQRWRPWRLRLRWLFRALFALAFVFLVHGVLHIILKGNVHTLIPGQVYRGGQPHGAALPDLVKRYGIRTILNLRGACYPQEWYIEEAKTAQNLGLALEDICFSAGRLPSVNEIRRLVEALDRAERPIYIHCRHGADRTSMASVLALLLLTDTPYNEARRQMSMRYAHAPVGRATILDHFFTLYERWLRTNGLQHASATLRRWLTEEYRPGPCYAVMEEVTPVHTAAKVGEPLAWRVRVRNAGVEPWRITTTRAGGMHVGFLCWEHDDATGFAGGAGFMDKTVQPGETLITTVVVPSLQKPGRYHLLIDLAEEHTCWFYQTGSEPYEEVFDVQK